MTNCFLLGKWSSAWKMLSFAGLLAFFSIDALGANSITGSVRNQSRGEPAVGDEVILIRLDRGMQEEARSHTDAHGAFTLKAQYPDRRYLVRVLHQGVSYDQQASGSDVLSIQVFDAARRVRGLTGSIEILRAGTNGNLLHVSDLVELKNESSPPLTLAGKRTFEVYLPANAKIDSVLAAGPGEMGLMISATPVAGEPGHYTVSFPLRPGATKFAFNYDLPFNGHAAFQTRSAYPLRQLAVMIPPTMNFASRSPAFAILATGNSRYQVHAANDVHAGEGPEFEVSGTGALPPLGDQDQTPSQSQSQIPPHLGPRLPALARAAAPSLTVINSRLKQTQPSSQSFILGGLTAVLLAACVLLVWRARKARSCFTPAARLPSSAPFSATAAKLNR
jgi:hypothetical protein